MPSAGLKKTHSVKFSPCDCVAKVADGENLLQAALTCGSHIDALCGGAGVCGRCKVQVKDLGAVEEDTAIAAKLSPEERAEGWRLACALAVHGDLDVSLPDHDRLAMPRERSRRTSTETEADIVAHGWGFGPALRKFVLDVDPPTETDNASDLARLLRAFKKQYNYTSVSLDFPVLRTLSNVLREGSWKVTATVVYTRVASALEEHQLRGPRKPKLIRLEPGDVSSRHYSAVFDIGTTSVWGQILSLVNGKTLAAASDYNAQVRFGADVITRIVHAGKPGGLEALQQAVVGTMNELIAEMTAKAGIDAQDITHLVAAGNTTMTQCLLGLDPRYIREAPYVPVANFIPPARAMNLGLKVGRHAHIYTFPLVSSYVGGDIVSGVLAAGFYKRKKLTLYIDIGTNGEIVLGNADFLVATSCSAGPAFEGGGITSGMRAADGAIEDFDLDPETLQPMILTIGRKPARGICGSGLINAISELFFAGILQPDGKFDRDADTDRVRVQEGVAEYVLVRAAESGTGKDIALTEYDVENLIRAKAAMYAGMKTLLKEVDKAVDDIEEVIIAGSFGNSIDIGEAIRIGLFPDLPLEKFTFIGNGSLLGARLLSLSGEMLDDAERIARSMTNVELSVSSLFMNEYISAMFLPHTELADFPSVPPPTPRGGAKLNGGRRAVAG